MCRVGQLWTELRRVRQIMGENHKRSVEASQSAVQRPEATSNHSQGDLHRLLWKRIYSLTNVCIVHRQDSVVQTSVATVIHV